MPAGLGFRGLSGRLRAPGLASGAPWRRAGRFGVEAAAVALRGLLDGQLNVQATSLAYTTLLSVVPLLAVGFSVLQAFGVHYRLEPLLTRLLEPLGPRGPEISARMVEFVNNVHVGVLGAVGLALLFYTVVSLVEKIEAALNGIWQVRRARPLRRKVTDYLSVLLVGPVLVVAALSLVAAAEGHWLVRRVLAAGPLAPVGVWLTAHATPYLLLAAAFGFLYRFLPAARVRLGSAAVGGLAAAALWHLSGAVFTAFVAGSRGYDAVYSGFAVVVVSLIWLQVAWLTVLVGGKVAFFHQQPSSYRVSRARPGMLFRERAALTALVAIARRHLAGRPPYPLDELAEVIGAPTVTLEALVEDLVARGLLARAAEPDGLVLLRAPDAVTVVEVLEMVRDPRAEETPLEPRGDPVDEVLARRERAVREALGAATLRSLAEAPAAETGVTDLARYRRR